MFIRVCNPFLQARGTSQVTMVDVGDEITYLDPHVPKFHGYVQMNREWAFIGQPVRARLFQKVQRCQKILNHQYLNWVTSSNSSTLAYFVHPDQISPQPIQLSSSYHPVLVPRDGAVGNQSQFFHPAEKNPRNKSEKFQGT